MEINFESLDGLDTAGAKEYIMGFLSTLKLTEKQIEELKEDEAKWERRALLARENSKDDLYEQALKEKARIETRRVELESEASELKASIEKLRSQLLVLPAKERSIDPDLLEQELLILAGRMPGDEKEAAQDRAFAKLENEASADAALEELKAKMGK